jgi:hypothetical protein
MSKTSPGLWLDYCKKHEPKDVGILNNSIVTVSVSGEVGCGKSAICGEIEIAMKALGLEVSWEGGDAEKRLTHALWSDALDLYKPKVVIKEVLIKPIPKDR